MDDNTLNLIVKKQIQLNELFNDLANHYFELYIQHASLIKLLIDNKTIREEDFDLIVDKGKKFLQRHFERLEHYKAQSLDINSFKSNINHEFFDNRSK